MKHRFLLHNLSHTVLVVDISEFGIEMDVKARQGNTKMVPALRFPVWNEAAQYFRAKAADEETIEKTYAQLSKQGVAVMTIV